MDVKHAGASLDSLVSSFNDRIMELQDLLVARSMYAPTAVADLSAINTTVGTLEYQVQVIKDRVREEMETIPKAEKFIELCLRQQKKLEQMLAHLPLGSVERAAVLNHNTYGFIQARSNNAITDLPLVNAEPPTLPKGRKGKGAAPRWYVSPEDLDSLSPYMRGRLTLDKMNAAINEMATYADVNTHLICAPKGKLDEDAWGRALELRDLAMKEGVKGKHFFLETDMKGSVLKLDNTGKAILTALRHLGRIQESRVGHHRVLILSKP